MTIERLKWNRNIIYCPTVGEIQELLETRVVLRGQKSVLVLAKLGAAVRLGIQSSITTFVYIK